MKPSAQNFIQCRQLYPVRRLLSSVENFIQRRYFFSLTKQQKIAHTETII